ncbi:hypothetical protein VRRI112168_03770 [Vreelandella rituensis]|uniref:Uncharacterized protein n=2 Tax=Vreelandella rituensis TaxID=2282306 RepID=A0A368U977_9GAMM|nr:hypothetical protein DU506_01025 [Halomonas rituensis]
MTEIAPPSVSNYVLEGKITAEQPLATCSKDLFDREGKKNQPTPVPHTQTALGKRLMFPSTGIRGTLRRRVRDVVRDRVIELTGNPQPFDLDTHFLLALGGIKGAGEEDKTSVMRIHEVRQKNPLLNLFGAGDAGTIGFLEGRLGMGNAICDDAMEPVIFSGARSDDVYRDPDQARFLSDADLLQLSERSMGNRELSRLKADLRKRNSDIYGALSRNADDAEVQAIREDVANIEAQMNEVREESGSKNSVGMPLAGWQAIPQGAVMSHRMIVRRASDVDMGLLLAGLDAWSLEPIIGAHVANGNGLVSAQWDLFEVTRKGKVLVGTVRCEPFSNAVLTGDGRLEGFVAAFDTFMADMNWDFNVPTKV